MRDLSLSDVAQRMSSGELQVEEISGIPGC